jgi:hypothetical protein
MPHRKSCARPNSSGSRIAWQCIDLAALKATSQDLLHLGSSKNVENEMETPPKSIVKVKKPIILVEGNAKIALKNE